MRHALALLSLAIVLAPACQQSQNNTKIVVAVWSDIPVPTGLDNIRIDVTGPTGPSATTSKTFLLGSGAGKTVLPIQLEVVPSGSASTAFTVTATGLLGAAAIVSQTARASFVPGKSFLLNLSLFRACEKVTTCPADYTCTAGACSQPIAIGNLPPYDPSKPPLSPDLSAPDAGADVDVSAGGAGGKTGTLGTGETGEFGGYGATGGSSGSIGTGGSIGGGGAMSTGGNQSTGDTTDSGVGCLIGATTYSSGEVTPTNPCQSCQPSASISAWSNLADGIACGAGEICHTGICSSGCEIGGAYAAPGVAGANPCQTCQPGTSTTAWSALADGTSCGQGQVCARGACGSQCDIGAKVYATATANPTNSCQSCQPGTSTTAWSAVVDGTVCTGGICHTGVCGNGCEIGGAYYSSGTANPSNACQSCQPATSRSAWTNLPNGTICAAGAVCDVGSCLADCYIGGTFYTPGKVSSTNACQSCQPTTSTSAWTTASGLSCSGSCVNGQTSTSNCGACGHSCSSGGASATSCSSGSCAPTCLAGHQDCSTPGSSSADDGCECAGTGCCGTGCQTAHSNGFGQTFYDCSPLNTYTVTSAVEACTALTGDAALCQSCATTDWVVVVVGNTYYQWTFHQTVCSSGIICISFPAGSTISSTTSGASSCGQGGTASNTSLVPNAWN